jgi:pyridoxal phosphate enzyme (YggS family)
MDDRSKEIQLNLNEIKYNIQKACKKSGRNIEDIKIVAVSKNFSASDIVIANSLGLKDFGENKVQELLQKFDEIGNDVIWHQIGHLQRNKVKDIIGKVSLIHSVCSIELLDEIEKQAKKTDKVADILLQINISKEETKFGINVEDVDIFLEKISQLKNVKVNGLMTIAPQTENPETSRKIFADLRELSNYIKAKNIENVEMSELSMGMSADYEVAIEEGATIIRVGTSLFGTRNHQI